METRSSTLSHRQQITFEDGLGYFAEFPEDILSLLVSKCSLPDLVNLMRVSKAVHEVACSAPQWKEALAQLNAVNVLECEYCARYNDPTSEECEECKLVGISRCSGCGRCPGDAIKPECRFRCEQSMFETSIRDPRISTAYKQLPPFKQFQAFVRYQQQCISNLHSFYNLDDFETNAPGAGFSYSPPEELAEYGHGKFYGTKDRHRVLTLLFMNQQANPERHILMVCAYTNSCVYPPSTIERKRNCTFFNSLLSLGRTT